MLYNLFTKLILSLLIASMLSGCATTNHGYGVIIAQRKVTNVAERQNYVKNQVKHDAITAGTRGVVSGAMAGVILLTSVAGSGFSLFTLETLGTAAVCAGTGALTLGLAGVVVGGVAGYIIEKSKAKSDLYQLAVRSLSDSTQIYTVRQYSPFIPLNTKVTILESNGTIRVKAS